MSFRSCSTLAALAWCALTVPAGAQDTQMSVEARLQALGPAIPQGTRVSIQHLLDTADRIEDRHPESAPRWRRRAMRYLQAAEEGNDPYPLARGEIVNRGYHSPISTVNQGYAIYIPPGYDPSQSYPLYIALHGGSSNGNLFLGVVLGNNMDWHSYDEHVYDDFTPRWSPDWIVVAPTGYGQIMWRWMGEQDVLDVIDDVQTHYNVDANRVVLGGLSNGGVGAYAIGTRHAWRFATVQAMAGAPSWLQYTGGGLRTTTTDAIRAWSGMDLFENTIGTSFRYYHGRTDTGPMRPRYIEEFTRRVSQLEGVPVNETWFDAGHDILYLVHRHGRVYDRIADTVRDPRPREVRVVTGDYRAARQHWLSVTRIRDYPKLARVRALMSEGGDGVDITTENTDAFLIDLRDAPHGETLRIVVDGDEVYSGASSALGHRAHLIHRESWQLGFPEDDGLRKKPGLSGPIMDAYYDRMVHVYGTANADDIDDLRRAAERGARGWPLWSWDLRQEVMADTELTDEVMQNSTVVLYASPGSNAVLNRIAGALPVRLEDDAITVGAQRFAGRDIGTRFIYPNPVAPGRYVIVQAAVTAEAVRRGNKLPEFLPDWAVYEGRELRGAQRRAAGRTRLEGMGYFDNRWQLPGQESDAPENEGAGPDQGETADAEVDEVEPSLPIPRAPAVPPPPRRFAAPSSDPAGVVARRIARLVQGFENYRAQIPGAVWRNEPDAVWSIQSEQECLDALAASEIPARPRPEISSRVATPVELTGPVGGVWFRMTHEERAIVMSCELALRLPELATVLASHGVHGVEIMSSYRPHPHTSFHTMGLALDLSGFWMDDGWWTVLDDYQATPMQRTCSGRAPRGQRARVLRELACELADTGLLSSILTPNYNEGHRDHFHIDARPNDPRVFVR